MTAGASYPETALAPAPAMAMGSVPIYIPNTQQCNTPLPMPPNDGYIPFPQPLRPTLPVPPGADEQRSVSGSTTGDSIYMSASDSEGSRDADGDVDVGGQVKEMSMQVLLEMLGDDTDVSSGG